MQRTVKSFGIITCFIIISLTLVGCFPTPEHGLLSGRGKIIESNLAFLVEGKTTREEVLLQFGEPDAVLVDGTILAYRWNVIMGYIFVQVLAPIEDEHYLFFEFNPNSTLRRFKKGIREMPFRLLDKKILEKLILQDIEKIDSSNESDAKE